MSSDRVSFLLLRRLDDATPEERAVLHRILAEATGLLCAVAEIAERRGFDTDWNTLRENVKRCLATMNRHGDAVPSYRLQPVTQLTSHEPTEATDSTWTYSCNGY